jgi:MoaA/NifB/PqqE/SkfB family radical SAM enzyme
LHFLGKSQLLENKPYLTSGHIKKLVTAVKSKNTTFFLTGGEPLLRRDLIDIVRIIKQKKFKCGIFTNATCLSPEISDELKKEKLDYLFFSMDGPQEIHDMLRGQGAFERTCENISYFSNNKSPSSPRIIMNVLILHENYDRLIEVIDIASRLKVDVIAFDYLDFLSNEEFEDHKNVCREKFANDFRNLVYIRNFTDHDFIDLSSKIENIKRHAKKKKIAVFFKRFNKKFIFRRKCVFPWAVLRISPIGEVYPCAQFYIKMGNIQDSSIEEIWNGEKFRNFRKVLTEERFLPGCNRCVKL